MSSPHPGIPLLIRLREGLQQMGEILDGWENAREELCRPQDEGGKVDRYTVTPAASAPAETPEPR